MSLYEHEAAVTDALAVYIPLVSIRKRICAHVVHVGRSATSNISVLSADTKRAQYHRRRQRVQRVQVHPLGARTEKCRGLI